MLLNVPKITPSPGAAPTAPAVPDPMGAQVNSIEEAAPPAFTAAPPVDLFSMTLSRPLKTHQGELRTLKLREPVAADFIEIGSLPFDVRGNDDNRRAKIDFKLAGAWAARLTQLDEIIIGTMRQDDFLGLVSRINLILMRNGADPGN